MKILITGANGSLGKNFCLFCESNKIKTLFKYDLPDFDICNNNQLENVIVDFKPDFFVNCAAFSGVDECEKYPEKTYEINAYSLKNISVLCQKYNIKLCHISTDYVYESNLERICDENSPLKPVNVYGKSKLLAEKIIQDNIENYFILRTSWLYGPYGKNFFHWVLNAENMILNLINDNFGNPTTTQTLSEIIFNIIQTENYGIYNASNLGFTTWYELAEEILKNNNIFLNNLKSISYKKIKRLAERPISIKMNISKIQNILNIKIKDWKSACKEIKKL